MASTIKVDTIQANSATKLTANDALVVNETLEVTGNTTLNGAVTLGDAVGDIITITGTLTATPIVTLLGGADVNGTEIILDADADTSITADTDDQIDIKVAAADDFRITANTFTALSGSSLETNTINETTAASGVTIDSLLIKDGAPDLNGVEMILDADADTTITADTDDQIDLKIGGTDSFIFTGATNTVASSCFRKNAIINGDFNVWQRGTSFATIADSAYSADRWIYSKVGAAVHTVSRSTDVPTVAAAGRLFNYSALLDCTTVDAAIAAGDFVYYGQRVEGFNFLPLAQRAFTLSFWVKATKTGIHCVSFSNSGQDRSYVAEYTINAANTWEKKTVNVSASPSAGTWDYTTGIGLAVRFALSSGSTYQTTANAWQTGNFFATANQVNATDDVANDFRICGVQLEPGSVATEFEQRTIQDELVLCQRYWQQTYANGVAAGTVTNTGRIANYSVGDSSLASQPTVVRFPVIMRTTPSVSPYSPGTGTQNKLRDETGVADVNCTTNDPHEGGVMFSSSGAGLISNDYYSIHYTASAEL